MHSLLSNRNDSMVDRHSSESRVCYSAVSTSLRGCCISFPITSTSNTSEDTG